MNWLLAFLLAYLLPGIDDLDVEPPVDDEPPADDEPADDEPPADDDAPADDEPEPEDDEPPAPRETRAQKAIRETRERAQNAERDLALARAELEAARRPQQPAQPQTPTREQELWQQEEDTLRNPEATDWQKYAIQANRSARQAQAESRNALAQAQDLADRSAFNAIAADKPKMFAAYKDRVEERVKEMRARGHNAPREIVLKMLLGEDMLAGKLRTPEKKPAKTGAAPRRAPASDVTPGASGGRQSDAERRAKRLENIRI